MTPKTGRISGPGIILLENDNARLVQLILVSGHFCGHYKEKVERVCHRLHLALKPVCLSMTQWLRLWANSRYTEVVAQIYTPHVFVLDDLVGCPAHQNLAVVQDVRTVNDLQRFLHIVVRDQHADSTVF